MDFIKGNLNYILPMLSIFVAWLLPAPRFKKLGKEIGEKLPPRVSKMIVEHLRGALFKQM